MTVTTNGAFASDTAAYIDAVFAGTTSAGAAMPAGLTLWVPGS
jgi:hypothetical protein